MAAELHVGQSVRFPFAFVKEDGTALDISGASVLEVDLRKPDGTVVTKELTTTSGGADGLAHYDTLTTPPDLDMEGNWELQGYAEKPDGSKWPSDTHRFPVRRNIKDR